MKVFIVSNGEMFCDDYYIKMFQDEKPQYIICADGGARHLKRLGITPTTIIGDFDSIKYEELNDYRDKNIEIIEYNPDKDKSDTQLAIEYAITKSPSEIVLLGVLGNRFDHSLANLYLLESIINKGIKTSIRNENNIIYLIKKEIELEGKKGDIISLLPFTDKVEGIFTSGLYYSLKNAIMERKNPYGISNIFTKERIKISIKSGLLLVILTRD
ncbi:thiamine diphosphokinase [Garciella nitratireducens]|uniref:Thiamine diphosphokinase n=1 Tax=Garciella nitratireducens DSM 15102 TaxID=1121911 RepID=A0A1T4JZ56_9FIRM|nr:thiamine diphosphokinase [Garciella nitratireducens]SJZ35399.1 thiamine pyrophosphokinase [Garciella nitratireducens DSM 15102]